MARHGRGQRAAMRRGTLITDHGGVLHRPPSNRLLMLQRAGGNAAVGALLHAGLAQARPRSGDAAYDAVRREADDTAAAPTDLAAPAVPEGCETAAEMPQGGTTVSFGQNEQNLDPEARSIVQAAAVSLATEKGEIRVHGFASTDGPEDYNLALSCARAKSVRDALTAAPASGQPSVDPSRIRLLAHGETDTFGTKLADNRIAVIESDEPPGQQIDPDPGKELPVFICSIPLRTKVLGALGFRHSFFRIGGAGQGNTTRELEPDDLLGSPNGPDCVQGVPTRDFVDDFTASDADCLATSISFAALEAQFASYPTGHYCTTGPNSNSFVGTLASRLGAGGLRPPGFLPGFDDPPPTAGTFAPSRITTLTQGCRSASQCPIPDPFVACAEKCEALPFFQRAFCLDACQGQLPFPPPPLTF